MANDANNVRVHSNGAIRVAPVGTAFPTAGTSASFGAGWVDLGYISEDGVTETPNADWSEIRAWQGRAIVRRTLTSSDVTFQFQCIESKQEVLELYYAGSEMRRTTGQDPFIQIVAPTYDVRAFGIDLWDGLIHERIVIPKGVVSDRGEVTYNGTDPAAYDLTITALDSGVLDSNNRPIYATRYSDSPAWSAFSSA